MKQVSQPIPDGASLFRNPSVIVAVAGTTSIGEISVLGLNQVVLRLANAAGGGALDALTIQYQYHPSGDFVTMVSTAANYTTPNWPVIKASADLTTLAANGSGYVVLDVVGIYKVRILASANTDPATVTLEGGAAMGLSDSGGAAMATGAGAVSATTQRVTLASDSPGVANLARMAGGSLALTAITKDTWTAITPSKASLLAAMSTSSGDSWSIEVWAATSVAGANPVACLNGQTMAQAKSVAVSPGTYKPAGDLYVASIGVVIPANATHILVHELTAPSGTATYSIVGV